MIVLDTNVLSALMRTRPEEPVVEWLDHQPADTEDLAGRVLTLDETAAATAAQIAAERQRAGRTELAARGAQAGLSSRG